MSEAVALWIGAHAALLGLAVARRVLAHFGVGN